MELHRIDLPHLPAQPRYLNHKQKPSNNLKILHLEKALKKSLQGHFKVMGMVLVLLGRVRVVLGMVLMFLEVALMILGMVLMFLEVVLVVLKLAATIY